MTTKEFNEKYNEYLEPCHYGLDISNPILIEWLDDKFQEFIKRPEFKYFQIKEKFGRGRFYCEGLTIDEINEVESKITKLCK